MLWIALLAEPAAGSVSGVAPLAFDLRSVEAADERPRFSLDRRGCSGEPGEIVVCARDPEEDRLRPLAGPEAELLLPPAEFGLGDTTSLNVRMEAEARPDGSVSNRIMVGVTHAF
jgi:hypothetical protein